MSKPSLNIRLKRVYEPASPDDGLRVLATRYWPRGIPRSAVHDYTTKVAPSRELLREFKHEGLTWERYVPRYLEEMQTESAKSDISRLADAAKRGTITLMCICEDENRCHRSLLRDLLIEAAQSVGTGRESCHAEERSIWRGGGSGWSLTASGTK